MTNLTDKFGITNEKIDSGNAAILAKLEVLRNEQSQSAYALSQQLDQQHTALMLLLGQMNTSLSTIATAIGGMVPQPDDTQAKILQELKDIHLDTQSIDLKLLRIRDAIAPLADDLPVGARNGIAWAVYRTMMAVNVNTPTSTAGSIASLLQSVLSSMVPLLSNILTKASSIDTNVGLSYGSQDTTVNGQLLAIKGLIAAIEADTGPISGDVANILIELQNDTSTNPCGCTTAAPSPTSCTDTYISSGIRYAPTGAVPSVDNVVYAVWPSPAPSDIAFGSVFGTPNVDYTTLKPINGNTWNGYALFVQSSSPTFSTAFLSVDRYPCGKWIPLSGTDEIGIIVPGQDSITAYLCLPGGTPVPNECIHAISMTVSLPHGEESKPCAVWASSLAQSFLPDKTGAASEPIYLIGNFQGWTVKANISGLSVYWYDVNRAWRNVPLPLEGHILQETTTYVAVYNNTGNGEHFVAEICPPDPAALAVAQDGAAGGGEG